MPEKQSPPAGAVSVSVQRSRRSGQHRAYVRVGATDAGFRDLQTGEISCTDPALMSVVETATAHLARSAIAQSSAPRPYVYQPRHAEAAAQVRTTGPTPLGRRPLSPIRDSRPAVQQPA